MPEFGAMMSAVYPMGDVTATFTALVVVGASNRQQNIALPGVRPGDVLSARPLAAIPDGYDVGAVFCTANDVITAIINHPALALNANYSIPLRIFKIV